MDSTLSDQLSQPIDHFTNSESEGVGDKSSNSSTVMLNPIGQCDESFRQRQSDVFAALANLEAAHLEVYKATKEERKAVRKAAWRHTVTAPENLAEQKERRKITPMIDDKEKINMNTENSTFRKPINRPPYRRLNPILRDPNKWTHYSLADVEEDAPISRESHYESVRGDPNSSIAVTLINELREHNLCISNVDDDLSENLLSSINNNINQSSDNDQIIIVNRHHKGQLRNRYSDNQLEINESIDQSDEIDNSIEIEYEDIIEEDVINSDEIEEDPEDDKTNDYFT
ncbi:unnamed protein product [Heterobilharzia americana]|nr:unnamed protein product [Heterobilharzia americana]